MISGSVFLLGLLGCAIALTWRFVSILKKAEKMIDTAEEVVEKMTKLVNSLFGSLYVPLEFFNKAKKFKDKFGKKRKGEHKDDK